MSSLELRAHVTGRVQGVGFRATARQIALSLQLKGLARNLPDRSVEIIVQGSKQQLEQFLLQLKEEFSTHIFTLTENYFPSSNTFDTFTIS